MWLPGPSVFKCRHRGSSGLNIQAVSQIRSFQKWTCHFSKFKCLFLFFLWRKFCPYLTIKIKLATLQIPNSRSILILAHFIYYMCCVYAPVGLFCSSIVCLEYHQIPWAGIKHQLKQCFWEDVIHTISISWEPEFSSSRELKLFQLWFDYCPLVTKHKSCPVAKMHTLYIS